MDTPSLFRVDGMVAVITGGGTGMLSLPFLRFLPGRPTYLSTYLPVCLPMCLTYVPYPCGGFPR